MFSEKLKEYTAEAHRDLERKMIPHLRNIRSREDYTQLLDFMHGYYEPLEERLSHFLPVDFPHSHAENIRKDIAQLAPGFESSNMRAEKMPRINSTARALGVLYVLEGSTLGGQVITKMISKQLGTESTEGFNFYNPYREKTADNWNSFRRKLNQSFTDEEQTEIIEGANETFQTLNNWISQYDGNNHR